VHGLRARGRHRLRREITIRGRTLVHDAANPAEVMRDVLAFATAGRAPEERAPRNKRVAIRT
jgi:hypothetical protein